MSHYKANLRDIEFTLFEVLKRQEQLGHGRYCDLDLDTARTLLHEIEHLATTTLADAFAVGDRTPPAFDPTTNSVTMPEPFKRAFAAYVDGGCGDLDLPEEFGGAPTPPSIRWALAGMVLGSNPWIHLYSTGPAFAHLFWTLGTEEQKAGQRSGQSVVGAQPWC